MAEQVKSSQVERGTGALIAVIAGFVVVGAPLVYYLWTTLNEVLAGHFDGSRLLVTAVVLLIFVGLLTILSRSVRRL
ncbi:MAG: hypothetical protein P8177_08000 [Gemmatimonadota bacterium]